MATDIENYIFDLSRELNIENINGVFGNELELIALVRNCPFLYDKSRNDFKDVDKREIAWRTIGSVLHCSIHDCRSRWKNLREQYGRIKRAIASNDPEAGKLIQWEFIEDMKFLDRHIRHRRQFKNGFLESDTSILDPDDDSYRIEWLEESKMYDNREVKLINLVKNCPLLYNKHNFDHKDMNKREQAWLSLSKEIGKSVLDCKTRWKTLRERYSRERKMQMEDPTRKQWEFYDELSFLEAHIKPRRFNTISLYQSTRICDRTSQFCSRNSGRTILPKGDLTFLKTNDSNIASNSTVPDAVEFQIQKMEYIDTSYQTSTSVDSGDPMTMSPHSEASDRSAHSKVNSNLQSSILLSPDEDDLFGQSIAAELKRISGRKKKMRLKADIFKLLCEAESDSN